MDENPLPVIILGLLSAALLVLPPVGYDVRLPKDTVTTQPPAPPGGTGRSGHGGPCGSECSRTLVGRRASFLSW